MTPRADPDQAPIRPLRESPPEAVARRLRERGVAWDDVLLCTHTDIDLQGNYQAQWLAVTPEDLLVVADGRAPEVVLALPLRQATSYRAAGGVGSGLLQACVSGTYIDVLRYSNRRAFRFEKIARKLDRSLTGEPIEVHAEDQTDPRRCGRCGLVLEFIGDTCPQCVSRGAVLLRMWKLMSGYRGAAAVMMALLIGGIALDLVSPQLTRFLVDHVLPGVPGETTAIQLRMLLMVVLVLAAVQVLRQVVNFVNGRVGSRVGTAITHDMRSRLVGHLQQLSVGFYDRQQVGALVGRVAYDTESLHSFVNQLTGGFLLQAIMLVGVGAMMFSIDVRLALLTLVPAPFVLAGTVVFWRYIYPRNYRTWDASSKQAGMLSGVLSGIRVVKALGQEDREIARFSAASRRLLESRRGVDAAVGTFNPIMGIVFQLGGWIVWYVGGRDVIEHRLTLGQLMAFFGYLWMFYGPLATLPQFTTWLTNFVTQAHRIFEILDTPAQVAEPKAPKHLRPMRGSIRFERVTFGYNRHTPVVRDLDLEIAPGEVVGVVGRSGSGKTTLVNLICRFYDVNEGRVLIDGQDVREIAREDLRGQVGAVLQDPFLFRASIWENIAYGRPGAAPEAVIAASKAGNCHDFIMRQPHAYDTWVGERGAGLSGGERQRVGIARVLLTDPRILILDEATSSVDAESEAAIRAALAEIVKGRTTIAIAHRLSTLRLAGRIVVMEGGRITESGAPDDLLRRNGAFARMVRIQQGRAAPGAAGDADAADVVVPADAHHARWLDPDAARIHVGTHNALHVTVVNDRIYGGAFAIRCRPVHDPRQFISLRYADGQGQEREIGLVRDLDEWPAEAQQLIEASLARRYFVHTIHAIHDIRLVNNYLNFDVDTDLGPQRFTMRWQHDRAQDHGPGGKMLLDTDENRYLVPDVAALPERQRNAFQRFVYW
jgi:ATP-binding cassette subfamily B protein